MTEFVYHTISLQKFPLETFSDAKSKNEQKKSLGLYSKDVNNESYDIWRPKLDMKIIAHEKVLINCVYPVLFEALSYAAF